MAKGLEKADSEIRARLIDSALTIIDRDGIDGARLRDIVDHADMTTGSLYWFFKNRRALINAALAERYIRKMRSVTDAAQEIMQKGLFVGDPFDLLGDIAIRLTDEDRIVARRERVQVLAAALDDPVLAKQLAEVQQTFLDQLGSVIASMQEQGLFRRDTDPFAVAVLLQATTIGLASVDLAPNLVPDADAWRHLMHLVLESLQP